VRGQRARRRAVESARGLIGLSDARYANVAGRRAHHDAIDAAIEAWTRSQPKEEVERRLKAAA